MRLKADLHTHAADDFHDRIRYSPEMLVEAAAKLNFDVLAVACHNRVAHTPRLAEYARRRNVVLIPAIEAMIEGRHVVILNPDAPQAAARTFAELRELGRRDAFVLAPHPYYPDNRCLRGKLARNLDCFDGIEFCNLYRPWLNPNRRAVNLARRSGRTLIGTSDCHGFPYAPRTFSWIDAQERSVRGVIEALRAGQVTIETRPTPVMATLRLVGGFVRDKARHIYSDERQVD